MKKVFVSMAIIATILACKKEELPVAVKTSSTMNAMSGGTLRIFYDNGGPVEGKDYGCAMSGGNCLDDIGVGGYDPALRYILEWVTMWLGNNGDDASAFITYRDELAQIFGAEIVEDVISNKLNLSIRGNLESENKCYFVFTNSDGNTISTVYPFVN